MCKQAVLITGCSEGGIGYALAKEFHRRGYRVIATARRVEAMTDLANLGIETLALDVSNDSSVKAARDKVGELLDGKLNILVNNAGQAYNLPAIEDDIERAKALFDVNVFGTMRTVKAFVDMLIASGDARIVQIGSIAGGILPIPFISTYNASKAAMHAYGDTLRVELAPFGIKVITIVTGFAKTKLGRYGSLAKDSLYQPMAAQFNAFTETITEYGPIDVEVYAKEVVKKAISQRTSAWIWSGNRTLYLWLVHTFAWKTTFDLRLSKKFGLEAFAAKLQSKAQGE